MIHKDVEIPDTQSLPMYTWLVTELGGFGVFLSLQVAFTITSKEILVSLLLPRVYPLPLSSPQSPSKTLPGRPGKSGAQASCSPCQGHDTHRWSQPRQLVPAGFTLLPWVWFLGVLRDAPAGNSTVFPDPSALM